MTNRQQLQAALRDYGLTRERAAVILRVAPSTLDGWLYGTRRGKAWHVPDWPAPMLGYWWRSKGRRQKCKRP